MAADTDWPEVGRDALDPQQAPAPGRRAWLPRRRPALGVRSTVAPSLIFILFGVLLGPHGLDLLSATVLERFEPVTSVALAVLGVFAGLGATTIPRHAAREAFAAGALSSAVTIVIVTIGLGLLFLSWGVSLPLSPFWLAGFIAICASASAAAHLGGSSLTRRVSYIVDVDDVPLIVLGTMALALLGGGGAAAAVTRLGLTVASGVGIGLAGWLLFERASGTAERGVFVTGAVLLMAGTGTYLGTSPLLTGGVAALVWVQAPGVADRIGAADLRFLQHPLIALLLIAAGALIDWSPLTLWAAVAVVLLRLVAKVAASFALAPGLGIAPGPLAAALLPPGVLGIALALNASAVLGDDVPLVVGVATAAAAVSELLAILVPGDVEDAS